MEDILMSELPSCLRTSEGIKEIKCLGDRCALWRWSDNRTSRSHLWKEHFMNQGRKQSSIVLTTCRCWRGLQCHCQREERSRHQSSKKSLWTTVNHHNHQNHDHNNANHMKTITMWCRPPELSFSRLGLIRPEAPSSMASSCSSSWATSWVPSSLKVGMIPE